MSLKGVYVERSDAEEATYTPQLEADATGGQILKALQDMLPAFNAAAEIAVKYGMKDRQYQTGTLEMVTENVHGLVCPGTKGDYPSANTALVMVTPNEGLQRLVDVEENYSAGTEFCFVHVQWEGHPYKHDLPMQESFYRSVRRTLAGHFEQRLRQQGI